MEEIKTQKEVLEIFGCSRVTLWRYKDIGLKFYKIRGKNLYLMSDLLLFMEKFSSHYSPKKVSANDRNR